MAVTTEQTDTDKPVQTKEEKTGVVAATTFAPSGAPAQITDIDVKHPAVDNNPRANTTERQNRADFNDPSIPGHDAVAEALNAQGVPTKTGAEAAKSVKTGK